MRRRAWIGAIAVAPLLLALAGGRDASAQETGDVPMFRGNPARTGAMPGPGPDPASGVEVQWVADPFETNEILSSPAVVDGVVYVGGGDGLLYAVDAATGEPRWAFTTGTATFRTSIGSSPAVVGGVVYVGGGDGNLYAADAVVGQERWRFTIGNPASGGVPASPAVVGGVVYIGNVVGELYALRSLGSRPLMLEVGGQAVTRADVVLRGGPAATAVERATLPAGTAVTITGEAVQTADGTRWWPVTVVATGQQGWLREEDLEPTANAPG